MRDLPNPHGSKDGARGGGRAAVLNLLKREGPISADAMAERLGVTAMAVRQHLSALDGEGLAAPVAGPKPRGRGRPVTLWRITAEADSHFADSHAALTIDLIAQMQKAFGDDGMERLLALRTGEQERIYRAKTDSKRTLRARLETLAKIRSAEGYMAELRTDPETGDYLFVENHCPICAAATFCQGLCREELSLFRRILGKDVQVERVSHILAGAGRCAYRVRA